MLIMFGGIVRNSVAGLLRQHYLHGGNELISPFLTTGVVASVMARMLLAGTITRYYDKNQNVPLHSSCWPSSQELPCTSSLASRTFIWHLFSFHHYALLATCSFRCTGHQLRKQWTMVRWNRYPRFRASLVGSSSSEARDGAGRRFMGFSLSFFGYRTDVKQSPSSLLGITLMMTLYPFRI